MWVTVLEGEKYPPFWSASVPSVSARCSVQNWPIGRTPVDAPAGRTVRVCSVWLVSFTYRPAAAICYEVEPVDGPARSTVQSELTANEQLPPGAALGGRWRLHDLRHTAAYRMARDPAMPLTDVQWVLGHAHLSTTQLYTTAPEQDVIAAVVAHHARRQEQPAGQEGAGAAAGYRPESLNVLFGQGPR